MLSNKNSIKPNVAIMGSSCYLILVFVYLYHVQQHEPITCDGRPCMALFPNPQHRTSPPPMGNTGPVDVYLSHIHGSLISNRIYRNVSSKLKTPYVVNLINIAHHDHFSCAPPTEITPSGRSCSL